MSDKIYKAISEHFIRRMRNWAQSSSGVGMYATSRWTDVVDGGEGDERMPLLIGEAADTDTALNLLPARYCSAVKLFWQYEGRPLAWFARRCGEGVDYRTYERRVIDGHEMLRTELIRQTARVSRYRASATASQNA